MSTSNQATSGTSNTSKPSTPSLSVFDKCLVCNKKVMFHNKCKCKEFFCSSHMMNHSCSYDHKGQHKKILEQRNPKIESEKLIQL